MTIKALLNGRVGTALVMLLIFMSMSLMALGFTEKARLMPLLVGIPGILLGIVQLTGEIRQSAWRSADEADSDALSKAERNMFLWTCLSG